MHIYLETERLILRRFTAEDVDNLAELDSDPEVMRHINGGTPTPRAEIADDYIPHFLRYYERGDRYGFWAAIEKATGEFLGWFHFRPDHGAPDDAPELGYRLKRSAWGKGYATEGSQALIDKGFREFGIARVTAGADPANHASTRVMAKVGMRLIRSYIIDDPDEPIPEAVEYAIERGEWERRNG
jgi:RimJ/RimL family protein N-acetyltransferase